MRRAAPSALTPKANGDGEGLTQHNKSKHESLIPVARTNTGKRYALILTGIAVSAVLLYLSLRKVELGDMAIHVAQASLPILLLSVGLKGVAFVAVSFRTQLLLRTLSKISLYRLFKSTVLGFAINNVLPFRAGEVARVGYLARHTGLPASTCLAVIALERVVDLFVLLVLLCTLLPVVAADIAVERSVYVVVTAAGLGLLAALVVSRRPEQVVRWSEYLPRFLGRRFGGALKGKAVAFTQGLSGIGSITTVAGVMSMTFISWVIALIGIRLWLDAFSLELSWYAPAIVLAFVSLGTAIPSAAGGIGTYHFLVATALTSQGASQALATSIAFVGHLVAFLPFTLLAIPLLLPEYLRSSRKPHSAEPPGRA